MTGQPNDPAARAAGDDITITLTRQEAVLLSDMLRYLATAADKDDQLLATTAAAFTALPYAETMLLKINDARTIAERTRS